MGVNPRGVIAIITIRATRLPVGIQSMTVQMGAMEVMAIITKTRALAVLASTGNSTLNSEGTMHALLPTPACAKQTEYSRKDGCPHREGRKGHGSTIRKYGQHA